MKNKMHNLVLISFGFFSALSFHPVWGRIAAAMVGIFFAIVLVASIKTKWRFLLLLVLPVVCFLIVTYTGNGLGDWLSSNSPEAVAGDMIYYFKEAGRSAMPATQGVTSLVKTGDPDSLANNGLKLHHFVMLLVSVFGAFVLCGFDHRKKA